MTIENWSDDVVVVSLPPEPKIGDELQKVISMLRDREHFDVVLDFSDVTIITNTSISKLLKLQKLLSDYNHQLILCSVAAATKGIFTVTGLDNLFEFVDDRFVALATLMMQD